MVIINGRIYTMEDDVIPCGYVKIKGKRIEQVGEMSSYTEQNEERFLKRCRRRLLSKGYVACDKKACGS